MEEKEKQRIVVISDLHGRDVWKEIVVNEPTSTKEVFLGDYFDSWDIPFEEQMQNFRDVLNYKTTNPTRVVLLLGNHDFHYLPEQDQRYSGYQKEHAEEIGRAVREAIDDHLLQLSYETGGFLFSHAGITHTWLVEAGISISADNIPVMVNRVLRERPEKLRYNVVDASGFGEHRAQGPLWVRPASLKMDKILGYRQVVGHTKQREGIVPLKGEVIFTDVLDHHKQYLVIENGQPVVKNL